MKIFRLLALTALLVTNAWSIKISYHPEKCPLDGTMTKVFEKASSNNTGGFDSDFCTYSSGGQWREYAIATCPNDLFTVYVEDFSKERDESTIKKLKVVSEQIKSEYKDLDQVQTWDRYEWAARFYSELGKDHDFIGEIYHSASWLARDRAVGFFAGLEGPTAMSETIRLGEIELAKPDLEVSKRKTLLYNMARVSHRAGEPKQRDSYLAKFEAMGDLTEKEILAVSTFKEMTQVVEPRLQQLAITEYQAYLVKSEIPNERKTQIKYMLADLLRRNENYKEAKALFLEINQDKSTPPELIQMTEILLEIIGDRG